MLIQVIKVDSVLLVATGKDEQIHCFSRLGDLSILRLLFVLWRETLLLVFVESL